MKTPTFTRRLTLAALVLAAAWAGGQRLRAAEKDVFDYEAQRAAPADTALLNGIAWVSKLEIPAAGVASTTPTTAELDALMDEVHAVNDILNFVIHTTTTFNTEPLSLEEREKSLTDRPEIHPATVAEIGRRIVGFGAIGAIRPRAAYARTAELSINVHRDFHRRGIGRAILADHIARARALGLHALVGGCCTENTPSIVLLEAADFKQVGRFPEVGRKFDRWLDVVFLQLTL